MSTSSSAKKENRPYLKKIGRKLALTYIKIRKNVYLFKQNVLETEWKDLSSTNKKNNIKSEIFNILLLWWSHNTKIQIQIATSDWQNIQKAVRTQKRANRNIHIALDTSAWSESRQRFNSTPWPVISKVQKPDDEQVGPCR